MTQGIHIRMDNQPSVDSNIRENAYLKGMVLNAQVVKKNDSMTTILLDERLIELKNHIPVVEAIGEDLLLEVTKVKKDSIELKYLPPNQSAEDIGSIPDPSGRKKSLEVSKSYPKELIRAIKPLDVSEEKALFKMVEQVKTDLSELVNKMTSDDVKTMLQQELNINKLSISLITQVVRNNKEAIYNHDLKTIKEAINIEVNHYKGQYKDVDQLERIIGHLKASDMPVNKKNLDKINEVLGQLKTILAQSDAKGVTLVSNKAPTTIQEAYKAIHTPLPQVTHLDMGHEDMTKMVKEYLEKNEMEPTLKAIEVTKDMISRNIDITKSKIDFMLNPMKKMAEVDIDITIKNIIHQMKHNQPTDQVVLSPLDHIHTDNKEIIKEQTILNMNPVVLINKLHKIQDSHILWATKKDTPMTLEQLFKVEAVNEEDLNLPENPELKVLQQAISHKRHLEEIRLKMSIEAATKLEGKGIKITTEPLERVVEALRDHEQQIYRSLAQGHEWLPTNKDLKTMTRTMDQVRQVDTLSDSVLFRLMGQPAMTIKEISTATTIDEDAAFIAKFSNGQAQAQAQSAIKQYEENGTKVRADLGDRVEKTFDQIESILKDLNLEVTPKATEAVQILARNEMPLTAENILQIQVVQSKVETITTRMNPHMVISMIKSGITPLDLDMDEMLEWMGSFEEVFGETGSEKISRLIVELDASKTLTAKERESLMGIYRTFDTVTRSKGAATGFLVKNGLPLNLEQLFEASKFIQKTKGVKPSIAADIDDEFGRTLEVIHPKGSIREQVLSAIENMGRKATHSLLNTVTALDDMDIALSEVHMLRKELLDLQVKDFITTLSQPKLTQTLEDLKLQDHEKMPLENLKNHMERVNELSQKEIGMKEQTQIMKYLEFAKEHPEIVKTMIKNEMPITPSHLEKAMALNKEPFELMTRLRDAINTLENEEEKSRMVEQVKSVSEGLLKGETTIDNLKKLLTNLEQELLDGKNTLEANDVKNIQGASSTLNHTQMIQLKDNYYQIPIMMGGEISQLNLYILGDDEANIREDLEGIKIFMSFKTKNLGTVQALVEIQKTTMHMNIQSSNKEDLELVKSFENEIKQMVAQTNFGFGGISYNNFVAEDPITGLQKNDVENIMIRKTDGSTFEIQI
ncbi:DUF6240 domain-containing protein [Petrocella sp. FN5]|uniref:DUF6240 domain-containing protein n=1 Tax=Petrocella sp. FN5 TaxID=3032002 RepID=UPI0023DBADF9|nr:DUF6240 domain-containing protein [Petrocella sp. FN5]MDF1618196.1 DUF6240 domain-containing protein [Petrocella sp. FN5]